MTSGEAQPAGKDTRGPFILAGPAVRPDPAKTPLRGDLAHIALAGKHFVPHYAVPQLHVVLPGGAQLRRDNAEDAEELCILMEGDSFEVLDVSGTWAWGCISIEGPVGYIRLDQLESLTA